MNCQIPALDESVTAAFKGQAVDGGWARVVGGCHRIGLEHRPAQYVANRDTGGGFGRSAGRPNAEEAEMLRLKRELKRLEEESVILRKATAVFGKGVA
jgi:transposase-like protein